MSKKIKLLYFSWIREGVGLEEESVALPSAVTTISELLDWLISRGEEFALTFENQAVIRVAVNHDHVDHSSVIGDAVEIAFFPPMSGG